MKQIPPHIPFQWGHTINNERNITEISSGYVNVITLVYVITLGRLIYVMNDALSSPRRKCHTRTWASRATRCPPQSLTCVFSLSPQIEIF